MSSFNVPLWMETIFYGSHVIPSCLMFYVYPIPPPYIAASEAALSAVSALTE